MTSTSRPWTVEITEIFYQGSGTAEPNEYVEFQNLSGRAIQLLGWTLRDAAGHIYTFPNFTLYPSQVCRVYTNQVNPDYCGFTYSSPLAIWNNAGDYAFLMDPFENIVSTYQYP